MNYLLDSNTYIEAKNFYYGMSICPAYWDWLDQQARNGFIASVKEVARELKEGNDELARWVKERADHFVTHDDDQTQMVASEIAQHLMEGDYQPASRDSFLAKADLWIIAKAKVEGATVVSHESLVQPNSRKVKVPNICNAFQVPCISTFECLHTLQANFILGDQQ